MLFNILVLFYLLLIIADDFTIWCYDKALTKRIGKYDTDDLPRPIYRKVAKLHSAKRTTRGVIRVLKVLLLIPIISALVVGVGLTIIKF